KAPYASLQHCLYEEVQYILLFFLVSLNFLLTKYHQYSVHIVSFTVVFHYLFHFKGNIFIIFLLMQDITSTFNECSYVISLNIFEQPLIIMIILKIIYLSLSRTTRSNI